MAPRDGEFLAGVIEGFYGPPWSQAERLELFHWMSAGGLNTYLYAPKDDLKHRALWREPYFAAEAESLKDLIRQAGRHGLRFVYAIGPGLDIRFHDDAELGHLRARFEQMFALGCQHFALLFDDIPERMDPIDLKRWGSFASAQCHVANAMCRWVRERQSDARFLFCPTPYCGRMAERGLGGQDYLPTIGRELLPGIDVFWTGPEIVSREITVSQARELGRVLGRKPLVWDNLHANDYDGRRFYCGPYSGRPLELRQEVSGLLVNPNNEFTLNYVPLRTLADFVREPAQSAWEPRQAYLSAMREWLARFATPGRRVAFEDLVLFGDCYYLPYEQGPEAESLYRGLRDLLAIEPTSWGAQAARLRQQLARLRDFCARLAELRERPLFYALSRRVWELREELDLLDRYLEFKSTWTDAGAAFRSDFHQPGTYRGGLVPRLQQLLAQRPDGTFVPAGPRRPGPAIPKPAEPPFMTINDCKIRLARTGDEPGAYYVCLKTGDFGKDGEPFYREDPDALGRIFVGPYLAYEPELSLILQDGEGICGYALGASDSRAFYERYEKEWRPQLCTRFPDPTGDPAHWTRVQTVYSWYHHPDYTMPDPYAAYPAHLHIDLLPRAQGRGFGRRMIEQVMATLRRRGCPGAHLGVSMMNTTAYGFYQRLGFRDLLRVGEGKDGCIYMGKSLEP